MLLEHLRQSYATLSKSHRRLADFVSANYREVAFMTSTQLARQVQVNEATVTRFAQQVGYRGYPEMVAELRTLLQTELAPAAGTPEADEAMSISLRLHTIADQILRLDQQLAPLGLRQVQAMLTDAKRITVLAQGNTGYLANLMAGFLLETRQQVSSACGDPHAIARAVADAAPGDVVVGISFLDESPEVAAALRYAVQLGAGTLAFASSPTNSVVQAGQIAVSWLADESKRAMTITQGISLLAAAATSLPPDGADLGRQQRLAAATDAILARRRR